MSNLISPPIFDGHNDVLSKLFQLGADSEQGFLTGYAAHIDLPKTRKGGFGGGFFALYVPENNLNIHLSTMANPPYDLPLAAEIPQHEALDIILAQAAILVRLEKMDALKICRTTTELQTCLSTGKLAAIMHIEGAEAIDENFNTLEVLYQAGLRSLGPVWSRPNSFGHGVPFRYPSTGDIGPGLTQAGKELVRHCNRLGIMLDVSHLNEAGFWDVVKLSNAPIVATHSNAYAVSPQSRNLTDRQLAAIADSDGMVGINFAVAFLRPDGKMVADASLDLILYHLEHLITHLGEDHVGIGSDFDGAVIPAAIGDCSGLPALRTAFSQHGINDTLMNKICYENWFRVLQQTWQ